MFNLLNLWQNHSPIFSILLPAITSFSLILLGNPGYGSLRQDWRQPWRRGMSLLSATLGLLLALHDLNLASSGQITVYRLSEWQAPFGIVLVLDQLSAFMLVLTYTLALPILWFASADWDTRGRYFHAMFHFLLMGLSGAFLTGDLFNLFVFFEILLMASYVLLLHGQGRARFQVGIHYVAINLFASALFLIGLGMIYGSVGSLNMADVSRLLATLSKDQQQLAIAGSLLLLVVFGIKAAMLPLGFWLPKTYAVAASPVAAIFALLTKVGIYAILRINLTVFAHSEGLMQQGLLAIGLLTSFYGVIAAMAAERLRRFVGFMVLSSIGTLLMALSMQSSQAWSAGLYYLVHSCLITAAFYLLCEWITVQRGTFKDHLKIAPKMPQDKLLAILFFIIALMMAGLPPFSGFLGKVFILQATQSSPYQGWMISGILITSLLSIIAFTRAGLVLFWRASPSDEPSIPTHSADTTLSALPPARCDQTIYLLLAMLLVYMGYASPIQRYTLQAAEQIRHHQLYERSILQTDPHGQTISVQPFDAYYVPATTEVQRPDQYARFIPHIISPATLQGEHLTPSQQHPAVIMQAVQEPSP